MAKRRERTWGAEEIAAFCEQISLILGAGIPLDEGVDALKESCSGMDAEAVFRSMSAAVKESGSLASAIREAGVFPPYAEGMVRIGEESGQLDSVMRGLADHYQQEAQIRRSAVSAVRYPLTLMAVMALVVTVLVFQVMPIFERAFRSLSGGMSMASASMMRAGSAAGMFVFVVMLMILAAALVIRLLLADGKRPALRRKLIAMVPAMAKLQRMMSAQRLASVLSMLLGSGFPLEQALELLTEIFETEEEKQAMRRLCDSVMQGQPIGEAIEATGLYDGLHLRMIRVGFASGQADAALLKASQLLAIEVDDAMGRLIAMIEPVLVVGLSALIGAILLSVMMPLAGVLGAMV